MSFEEIINEIYNDKTYVDNENICMICGDPLRQSEFGIIHKLKCSHEFHLDCIYNSYKYSNGKKKRECPYCRKDGGYLPLKTPESKPIKHINKEFIQIEVNKKNSDILSYCKKKSIIICCGIKKNGEKCTHKAYPNNDGFCRIHKKK